MPKKEMSMDEWAAKAKAKEASARSSPQSRPRNAPQSPGLTSMGNPGGGDAPKSPRSTRQMSPLEEQMKRDAEGSKLSARMANLESKSPKKEVSFPSRKPKPSFDDFAKKAGVPPPRTRSNSPRTSPKPRTSDDNDALLERAGVGTGRSAPKQDENKETAKASSEESPRKKNEPSMDDFCAKANGGKSRSPGRTAALEREIEDLKARLDQSDTQCVQAESDLVLAQVEAATAREEVATMRKQLFQQEEELVQKEAEIKALKAELASSKSSGSAPGGPVPGLQLGQIPDSPELTAVKDDIKEKKAALLEVQHSLLESPRSQRKQLKKDAEMLDMEIADLMEEKEVLTPR